MARPRLARSLAALAAGVASLSATAWAAPPTEVPDQARVTAQRNQLALGFDPTLAPNLRADTVAELQLEARDDGSLRYVDRLGRFTADIHPDGTVSFADPWRRPGDKNPERGVCCGRPPRFSFPNFNMSGPVEWLMYMSDQDPLRREKVELLDRTRTFRTRLAIDFARARIAEALERLDSELTAIWSDPNLSPVQRRALIFARWDECDERFNVAPASLPDAALSVIDAERVAAAEKARRDITRFVAAVAPPGSDEAYSPAELEALNADRLSQEVFAPYAAAAPPPSQ